MGTEDVTHDDWIICMLVEFVKGGMCDLNNWRDINLLDATSKIMSAVIIMRAQELLETNGHPMKFSATPKAGFSEVVFSLKPCCRADVRTGMNYMKHLKIFLRRAITSTMKRFQRH